MENNTTNTEKVIDKEFLSQQAFIDGYLNKDNPTLFLNAPLIKEKYPNFFLKIKKYLENELINTILEDDVVQIIFATPRFLYDFFDQNKIFINIMGYENKWYYSIEMIKQSPDFKSRVTAEYAAFMDAIKIINEK